ncbi:MAG: hypothetical protein AAF934_09605 [Bacteroidota bacterium]
MRLFLLCFLWVSFMYPQKKTSYEPEFVGDMVLKDSAKYIPLEKQRATARTKISASTYIVGVGSAKARNYVNKGTSPVRITQRKELILIVNAGVNERNPLDIIHIFKLEAKRKKRFVELAKATTFSGGSAGEDIQFIPFTGKQQGKKSYQITIEYLIPGEYAVTIAGSRDMFNMFGVDPPKFGKPSKNN